MNRILTAKDYAKREGTRSVKERIRKKCTRANDKGRVMLDTPFVDEKPTGKPVKAEINAGRWIARCECGGAEAVDPEEPIFYCFACGNFSTKGRPRAVTFPENREAIEAEILKRAVILGQGTNLIARLVNAQPVGYPRAWIPEESLADLKEQNQEMGA